MTELLNTYKFDPVFVPVRMPPQARNAEMIKIYSLKFIEREKLERLPVTTILFLKKVIYIEKQLTLTLTKFAFT